MTPEGLLEIDERANRLRHEGTLATRSERYSRALLQQRLGCQQQLSKVCSSWRSDQKSWVWNFNTAPRERRGEEGGAIFRALEDLSRDLMLMSKKPESCWLVAMAAEAMSPR
ncbi:hypothetical protein EYF80_035062 [Liparis tanakae]|uniref:Uncharacterized protein n=1 Tax=Liparis tanakae TaxID=230148 RepID=A0A4Z2GN22_9TELE|nr:hypothetical protein EYF80_035062 [Liparis tanakae]